MNVLKSPPERITVEFLLQFPEFAAFRARTHAGTDEPAQAGGNVGAQTRAIAADILNQVSSTPDELLRNTVKELETALRKDLLDRILAAPPHFFESLIVDLLVAMGYGGAREAGRVVGRSGDGGIDGVIDQDALGLDRVYLQAKRYATGNAVSAPEIHAFSGSIGAAKASKGVFVTTSYYTQPAIAFAERHPFRIVLIDGEQLGELMIRHNVGTRIDETFHIKKVDEDFFAEE